jgi:hypothetical protein
MFSDLVQAREFFAPYIVQLCITRCGRNKNNEVPKKQAKGTKCIKSNNGQFSRNQIPESRDLPHPVKASQPHLSAPNRTQPHSKPVQPDSLSASIHPAPRGTNSTQLDSTRLKSKSSPARLITCSHRGNGIVIIPLTLQQHFGRRDCWDVGRWILVVSLYPYLYGRTVFVPPPVL